MRDDLVTILGKQRSLTHVLVTTFNIDYIFIENILLRRLRKCGHPSLTIFVDADEAASAYASQSRWLSKIGKRYRVVPVRMEPGYRFHPKVVLLSGEESARLFVGSGNLTFGGMRQNEESWLEFDTETDGTAVIAACRQFFDHVLDRVAPSHLARADVADAFSPSTHAWANDLAEPDGLLWKSGSGTPLADQMINEVPDADVDRIVVASPYYDDEGAALGTFRSKWPDAEIVVIAQPVRCGLTASAWERLAGPKRIVAMESERGDEAPPFVHAKCFAFISGDQATAFVGSANCTRAALTIPGRYGNAEALARLSMSASEVDTILFAGLQPAETTVELAVDSQEGSAAVEPHTLSLKIEHARHFAGELSVTFHATGATRELELIADGIELSGADLTVEGDVAKVRGIACPSTVCLRGFVAGEVVTSTPRWVDDELCLSASSQQRAIASAISQHMAAESWSIKGWSEILRLLGDHLAHNPAKLERTSPASREEDEPEEIPAEVFFSDDYRLPRRGHGGGTLDDAARISGLGGLLARYLGDHDDLHNEGQEDESDEDMVDRPEDIRQREQDSAPRRNRDPSAAERKRAKRVATKVVARLTDSDFVKERPASMLASDLAITAVLLTSGHAEGWLAPGDYVDLTYQVWTHLFFDASPADDHIAELCGAIPERLRSSSSPDEFRTNLATVQLAAALAIWCLSVPEGVEHNERSRFALATRLSVAHAPWLWSTPDTNAFADEMEQVATRSGWLGDNIDERWGDLLSRWEMIYAQGRALARFESAMLDQDLEAIRETLPVDQVDAGTLLWAGPKLGFCILTHRTYRRRGGDAVPIMTLRSRGRETRLARRFVLPFGALAEHIGCLGDADNAALQAFKRGLLDA